MLTLLLLVVLGFNPEPFPREVLGLEELASFPPHEYAVLQKGLADSRVSHLEQRRLVDHVHPYEIQAALDLANHCQRAWQELCIASDPDWTDESRVRHLDDLREELGPVDFFLRLMPSPIWCFTAVD